MTDAEHDRIRRNPPRPWRTAEYIGGPWDGKWLWYTGELFEIEFRGTGTAVHRYELGEVYEGPRIRQVLRYVEARREE